MDGQWTKGLLSVEEAEGEKTVGFHTAHEKSVSNYQILTDLAEGRDTELPTAEFHSRLAASLRSHPCTHTPLSQSRRHRHPRPSACTTGRCHLTTDN